MRKISRAAMAASIACGALGAVAVSADAADTLYFVNGPVITGATTITPESATLSGYVDTGGVQGGTFTLSAGGTLAWGNGLSVLNTTTGTETFSTEGLPVSGSSTGVMISGGTPAVVSNDDEDNFSDVTFKYDTMQDYTAAGNAPGPLTTLANEVDVPTNAAGLTSVNVEIGAFGSAAQDNTANSPLNSNTEYVYWIVDDPGGTDQAESVNTYNPKATNAATATNPSFKCLPDSYIAANTYLSTLTSATTVSGGLATPGGAKQAAVEPGIQGPCVYFYGNASGADLYASPTGTFTTAALGKESISSVAKVVNGRARVPITNKSLWKASGVLELDNKNGDELATGTFGLAPGKSETFKLKLTRAGRRAAAKDQVGDLTLTSNWGQPTVTTKIKLKG